ncbi:MAG: hypothetical protein RI945_278 [Candidatus Parcubacteria bacterium]
MDIKINDHPFYQDPRFATEKKILEKLTEICGFDTSIGVIDYFPKTPSIEIGFIGEQSEKEKFKNMPLLKSSIHIYPTSGGQLGPLQLPEDLSFLAVRKILVPLIQNWIEVVTFLIEFYEAQPEANKGFLETSKKSLEIWKKDFTS